MRDIFVYSRKDCAACHHAKQLLKRNGLPYHEIDVTSDPEATADLVDQTGLKTLPQIFINEAFVGGYAELAELERRGRLLSMLTAKAIAVD